MIEDVEFIALAGCVLGDRVSFVRQDLRPDRVDPVDPESLHPRARALIFLPDLVSDYIEAAFSEPIAVTCLSQTCRTDVVDEPLNVRVGDPVIVRNSLIQGATTHRNFIHAQVHLSKSRVSRSLLRDLRHLKTGLGRLLEQHAIDHRREMMWWGVESADRSPVDLAGYLDGDRFAVRCYRLVDAGVPFVTIVERFSVDLFGD